MKSKRSLRKLLVIWFLVFSTIPIAIITFYSLHKFSDAMDQELSERVKGNRREIQVIFNEFEEILERELKKHVSDKSLRFYLTQGQKGNLRQLGRDWMKGHFVQRLSIFNKDGRMEVALFKNEKGQVVNQSTHEAGDVYLSKESLEVMKGRKYLLAADFSRSEGLDLIAFSPVSGAQGQRVGYIEEVIQIDHNFLKNLKKRLSIELVMFSPSSDKLVSSRREFNFFPKAYFRDQYRRVGEDIFEMTIDEESYGFLTSPLKWGANEIYLAIGVSKKGIMQVLTKVQIAFYTVSGIIIVLLIIFSSIISYSLLKPLNLLVAALQKIKPGGGSITLPKSNLREFEIITKSFNHMTQRIDHFQKEQENSIIALEAANKEIKAAQTKLAHTAKMVSLGKLVAGIAHELNNPISFIYSNLGVLKEYSDKLLEAIARIENHPENIHKIKEEIEYDFLLRDIPKLLLSCEEGARRTREIVLGLRNFSRLEEAKLKVVDLHEGLDSTLNLLTGETKNRVEVVKNYGEIPNINCYASELNQVFMNILTNAVQSIDGSGKITVTTRLKGKKVIEISILDTGQGMDQETQEQIFDPFFTTKSVGEGTGLGMSISYGVIKKHEGDIRVTSKINQGTEFVISLPLSSTVSKAMTS